MPHFPNEIKSHPHAATRCDIICGIVRTLLLSAFSATLLLGSLSAAADTNGVMTTIAEFIAPTSYVGHENRPFRLEGTCVCAFTDSLVLKDATGRAHIILDSLSPKPAAGMRVVVSGHSCAGWLTDLYDDICQRDASLQIVTRTTAPVIFEDTTVADLVHETRNLRLARFRGWVVDIFQDDIDYDNLFVLVRDGDDSIAVCISAQSELSKDIFKLIDTQVEVAGILMLHPPGERLFFGPYVLLPEGGSVRLVSPAPADPFDAPSLDDLRASSPRVISAQGRRTAVGTVLAVRQDGRFLVKDPKRRVVNVTPALRSPPPTIGTRVRVSGYAKTDLYRINLIRALWRPEPGDALRTNPPATPDISELLGDDAKRRPPQMDFYGTLVRLRGIVRTSDSTGRACTLLEAGGRLVPLEAAAPDLLPSALEDGCTAEVTGVWVFDADNWQPELIVPHITGTALVVRGAEDIRVLARPPWWTPRRFWFAIAVLLAALAGFTAWNRILGRLFVRKCRELHRQVIARDAATQRIDERTRLAAELHDALSQNLSAIACQVNIAKSILPGQTESRQLLQTAEQMLLSTRTELTRCLFDLRGSAIGEPDLGKAVRQTLSQLDLPPDTTIDIGISRKHLDDTTVHALLCIIRELAANAIRHGRATSIRIGGERRDGFLEFSVEDNGCGFDTARRPGPDEGHFGLSGIIDRVRRIEGTFDIISEIGKGTRATIRIKP